MGGGSEFEKELKMIVKRGKNQKQVVILQVVVTAVNFRGI